ncbi:MAG: hypothetical protein H0U76_26220, partial [Ktedonobacteraceae bacterium]|nr:hypothetical protein [Ktedonobacteraceae bacterium]
MAIIPQAAVPAYPLAPRSQGLCKGGKGRQNGHFFGKMACYRPPSSPKEHPLQYTVSASALLAPPDPPWVGPVLATLTPSVQVPL